MTATMFHGPADAVLASALAAAGFAAGGAAPAALLVNLGGDAGSGIAAAERFAADAAEGGESLVVNILHAHARDDWPAARDAALLWAFTRHAALAWAPRGIRVNAVGLGVSPVLAGQPPEASGQAAGAAPAARATVADIAATIVAMWRFASMTGQLIRLGA
jgi:hypothetical protein